MKPECLDLNLNRGFYRLLVNKLHTGQSVTPAKINRDMLRLPEKLDLVVPTKDEIVA